MLFDPPNLIQPSNPLLDTTTKQILSIISDGDPLPQRVRAGVYEISHFSFDFYLDGTCNTHKAGPWDEYPMFPSGEWNSYGVCDSIEQFFDTEFGKYIETEERSFVVSFTVIRKCDQPPQGGWRWHKWGPYIGKHNPQHEYLYNEETVEEVYVYHVYEHVDGKDYN